MLEMLILLSAAGEPGANAAATPAGATTTEVQVSKDASGNKVKTVTTVDPATGVATTKTVTVDADGNVVPDDADTH